jgi:hypothetical protein
MMGNQDNSIQLKNQHNWLDVFFGILVNPIKTFNFVSSPELYSTSLSALPGSMLAVITAAIADSCISLSSSAAEELISDFLLSVLVDLFAWFVLATFARLLAAVSNIKSSMRSCLIVTGWSFVPLIFKAPAACLSNVSIFGDVLSVVVSLWFIVLVLLSFDSLLKFGKLKTLAFVVVLPPCLFFSYVISIILANKFIIDGFF